MPHLPAEEQNYPKKTTKPDDYDENAEDEAADSDTGQRLVGASRASTGMNYPFVVGYNLFSQNGENGDPIDYTACTGSLITPYWFISAAHCISGMVIAFEEQKDCIKSTKQEKEYTRENGVSLFCTEIQDGNVKIKITNTEGFAYFGVVDVNNPEEVAKGDKIEIDYMVWNSESYRGGGNYGEHGGYDLALFRMKRPAPSKYSPACLPGQDYVDNAIGGAYRSKQSADLAGFGAYHRKDKGKSKCETDGYGKSKYHYCAKEGNTGCKTDQNPPQSSVCERFFADTSTPNKVPDDESETIIISGRREYFCYHNRSPKTKSNGWCEVKTDASQMQRKHRLETTSWGFCSKDCYLDDSEESSVLRYVQGIDILNENLCQEYLKSTIRRNVEIDPRILCIGYKKTLKYSMWQELTSGFEQIKPGKDFQHPMALKEGENFYIHSAGTCKGDSGGPVFTKDIETGRYVVLGAVSGGRGVLKACGGINNPTHYTRLKHFGLWIKLILGEESQELCSLGGPLRGLDTPKAPKDLRMSRRSRQPLFSQPERRDTPYTYKSQINRSVLDDLFGKNYK